MRNDQSETITLAPRYVRQSICTIEPDDFAFLDGFSSTGVHFYQNLFLN